MLKIFDEIPKNLLNVLFPVFCNGCANLLLKNEKVICLVFLSNFKWFGLIFLSSDQMPFNLTFSLAKKNLNQRISALLGPRRTHYSMGRPSLFRRPLRSFRRSLRHRHSTLPRLRIRPSTIALPFVFDLRTRLADWKL